MAKSPLRKTIGIQTAGNQRQFATHRKNKTTKCLSDHRICRQLYYRNKLEFTFSNKRFLTREEISREADIERTPALGFHVPGLFDKVVDIDHCCLQGSSSNEIRNFIKTYALKKGLSFYDIRAQQGFLRTLIIRTASTGEIMVILAFGYEDTGAREQLLETLVRQFPQITSLMYVINEKLNDNLTDQDMFCFHGRDHIFEEMEGLKFKIGPKSFYQTNSEQAYNLYSKTRELAGLTGQETSTISTQEQERSPILSPVRPGK